MASVTQERARIKSRQDRRQPIGLGAETEDFAWKGLFKIGGAAALIAALIFRRNLGAEVMLLSSTGITNGGLTTAPTNVADWFTLLQHNPLLGLTLLNLFDMVNFVLVGLMFLALCVALRRINPAAVILAAAAVFIGVAIYLASNQALTMLALSGQYATATSDMQRSLLLAAGQATLASHQNAGYEGIGLYPGFFCVTVAELIIAVVMLRSHIFSKATAYVGILANGFGLSYYLALVFTPALIALPLSISAPFLLAWYLLISRRLFQLGTADPKAEE